MKRSPQKNKRRTKKIKTQEENSKYVPVPGEDVEESEENEKNEENETKRGIGGRYAIYSI